MNAGLDFLNIRRKADSRRFVKGVGDLYKAMDDAYAVAILTEWDEFKSYDWQRVFKGMRKPVFLFDGRNLAGTDLKADGFKYEGIGRG